MSDFFEEYGWLIIEMLGGSIILGLFLRLCLYKSGPFVNFILNILGGLM